VCVFEKDAWVGPPLEDHPTIFLKLSVTHTAVEAGRRFGGKFLFFVIKIKSMYIYIYIYIYIYYCCFYFTLICPLEHSQRNVFVQFEHIGCVEITSFSVEVLVSYSGLDDFVVDIVFHLLVHHVMGYSCPWLKCTYSEFCLFCSKFFGK
jgi:hypothetical protein